MTPKEKIVFITFFLRETKGNFRIKLTMLKTIMIVMLRMMNLSKGL